MSKIIMEYALAPGYRVTLRKIDFRLPYQISSEQHYTTHSDRPHWDHDADGWRQCVVEFASNLKDAEVKYNELIESEKRWH